MAACKIKDPRGLDDQEWQSDGLNRRWLNLRQILALCLVASLALAAWFNLMAVIDAQDRSAMVINLAGRQRMLSQRMLYYAQRMLNAHEGERRELANRVWELCQHMSEAHEALSRSSGPLSTQTGSATQLPTLYFAGPQALDRLVQRYLDSLRQLASLEPWDQEKAAILFQEARYLGESRLLSGLDEAVSQYQLQAEDRMANLRHAQDITLGAILTALGLVWLFIFRPMNRDILAERLRMQELNRELGRRAHTDLLTGWANRHAFWESIPREMDLAQRHGDPLALIMFDLDHFKLVNDRHGHAVGDKVLAELARRVRSQLRTSDYFFRWGGEEFLLLLPHTTSEQALFLAERIRKVVAEGTLGPGLGVTISLGVTSYRLREKVDDFLGRADQGLYKAKHAGRNQVAMGDDENEDRNSLQQSVHDFS